mmetsp:Transcript_16320/g.35440  ORF Transcript_16320/g.35440 Transcript_16320/m.35440 type:complete len:91 (+) Transcript_16320:77-349(+)
MGNKGSSNSLPVEKRRGRIARPAAAAPSLDDKKKEMKETILAMPTNQRERRKRHRYNEKRLTENTQARSQRKIKMESKWAKAQGQRRYQA